MLAVGLARSLLMRPGNSFKSREVKLKADFVWFLHAVLRDSFTLACYVSEIRAYFFFL